MNVYGKPCQTMELGTSPFTVEDVLTDPLKVDDGVQRSKADHLGFVDKPISFGKDLAKMAQEAGL